VIIRLNEVVLKDVSDLRNRIALITPETKITLDIIRNGEDKKLSVTIGEQPSDFGKGSVSGKDKDSLEDFGLILQDLTPELADKLGYEESSGVVISDVQQGSSAAAEGLKPGYLIEEVNRYKVGNLQDLNTALKQTPDAKRILLRIRAGDYSRYVVLAVK
jgi:serine protease Do